MSIVALLRQNALFSRASPSHLEALATRFHPRNYRAGQIVFHQGDSGLSLMSLSLARPGSS
jgi:CRP-like cAMP-binding protein